MSNFLARIGTLLKRPVFSGMGGMSGLTSWNPRALGEMLGIPVADADADAGPLWKSSIPLSCLKFEQRASIELELVLQQMDASGDWAGQPRHRVMELLRSPNPHHTAAQFMDAVRWDWHLDGNVYLYKERSAAGRVVALWHIPSWMIDPRWDEGGLSWVDCFEYRVNGQVFAVPTSDIIHLRNGYNEEWHGRKGLSEFAGVLREVLTDDEAAVFCASLMKNMGLPGVIISPESSAGNVAPLNKDERRSLKEQWREDFTGQNRGEPFVHSLPIKVQFPGYTPQQLVLDKVRAIPEQRIAGAFGLPMSVLQLGSGVVNSNSRANKSDDREQAYESCILPNSMMIADQMGRALLPEFGLKPYEWRLWFDTSNVRCLQKDENEEIKTLVLACGGPFLTPNEARQKRGLKPQPGRDVLREKAAPPTGSDLNLDNSDDNQTENEENNV